MSPFSPSLFQLQNHKKTRFLLFQYSSHSPSPLTMDLKSSTYLQSHGGVIGRKENHDPMGRKDGAASTQGRPGFSFDFGVGSRKNFPSKWDDAEKWLINGHESPARGSVNSANFMLKQCGSNGCEIKQQEKHQNVEAFLDESRVIKAGSVFQEPKIESLDHHHGSSESFDVLLKDKFTNEVEPFFLKFKCMGTMEVVQEVKNRDTGTEMTPIGSSTTSRCPTPVKSLSPPRHNTPESRLVPPALIDQSSSPAIGELQECNLANKLQPWTPFDAITSNWSSRDEEEEEISKSLRHFEMNSGSLESISGPRPSAWEEQENFEPCIRYQIQEAKIQAWVNLQNAKAQAQSRKLEVKIQKMRSNYEEKLMKKMTLVHRKADEMRAAARLEHSKMAAKSNKTLNRHPSVHFSDHRGSCGCLIRN